MKSYFKKHYRFFAMLGALVFCNICTASLAIGAVVCTIVGRSMLLTVTGPILGIIFWGSRVIFIYLKEKGVEIPVTLQIVYFALFVAYVVLSLVYWFS